MNPTVIHILLIEDSPPDARLFQLTMRRVQELATTITPVVSLQDALRHLATADAPPDLIVLDLSLPDAIKFDGLEALQAQVPEVPVVIHSGQQDKSLMLEAVKRGAQDYLVKAHYNVELLSRTLKYALERQRINLVLKESEQRLRSIIENVSDGLLITDLQGTVRFANPASAKMLGVPIDGLIGAPFGTPKEGRSSEMTLNTADGLVRTIELRISPILWENQPARLAALRDISTHKALEKQLKEAKSQAENMVRLKTSLMADMNHDLRTPLSGIVGFAEVLVDELEHPRHQEFAKVISDSGNRLLNNLNALLEISQLEHEIEPDNQHLKLSEVIASGIPVLRRLAEEKGLSLEFHATDTDDTILGDALLLERIIDNLIGNAIKYTDSGSVKVGVSSTEDQVMVSITDTGRGIDPAFLPYLFDPYRREPSSGKVRPEGKGLGLSITHRLVRLMMGKIEVDSLPGKGTSFTVLFPQITTEPQPPAANEDLHEVLMVNLNGPLALLVNHILRPYSQLTLAESRSRALMKLADHNTDVLFYGVEERLQPEDLQFMSELNHVTHRPLSAVVAIPPPGASSSRTAQLHKAGFTHILSQPFTKGDVLMLVKQALQS